MSWGASEELEFRRALADLCGVGLPGGETSNAVLRKIETGTYTPGGDGTAATVTTDYAVAVNMLTEKLAGDGQDTAIRMARRAIMLNPGVVPLERGWQLIHQGITYSIVGVSAPLLQDTVLSYELELKV